MDVRVLDALDAVQRIRGRGEVRTHTPNTRASQAIEVGRPCTSSRPTSTVPSSCDTLHREVPQSAPFGPEGPLAAPARPLKRPERQQLRAPSTTESEDRASLDPIEKARTDAFGRRPLPAEGESKHPTQSRPPSIAAGAPKVPHPTSHRLSRPSDGHSVARTSTQLERAKAIRPHRPHLARRWGDSTDYSSRLTP